MIKRERGRVGHEWFYLRAPPSGAEQSSLWKPTEGWPDELNRAACENLQKTDLDK